MSDHTLQMTMLFDFYGELLTDKQREYFDLYYNEDLSLGEIAEQAGVTRQAVHDNLVRGENALKEYEAKTGLLARFEQRSRQIEQAQGLTASLKARITDPAGEEELNRLEQLLELMKG